MDYNANIRAYWQVAGRPRLIFGADEGRLAERVETVAPAELDWASQWVVPPQSGV